MLCIFREDIVKLEVQNETRKTKNIDLDTDLNKETLTLIKAKAETLGLPYQTLISSILHQYANGTLVSKERSHETA